MWERPSALRSSGLPGRPRASARLIRRATTACSCESDRVGYGRPGMLGCPRPGPRDPRTLISAPPRPGRWGSHQQSRRVGDHLVARHVFARHVSLAEVRVSAAEFELAPRRQRRAVSHVGDKKGEAGASNALLAETPAECHNAQRDIQAHARPARPPGSHHHCRTKPTLSRAFSSDPSGGHLRRRVQWPLTKSLLSSDIQRSRETLFDPVDTTRNNIRCPNNSTIGVSWTTAEVGEGLRSPRRCAGH